VEECRMIPVAPSKIRAAIATKGCLCCAGCLPSTGPRICPVCGKTFQGNGWDGIDAHWRGHKTGHLDLMPYEEFWKSLCHNHK
jgi:hypothetical protein